MTLSSDEVHVLQQLAKSGGTGNVMQFLNYSQSDFDRGFEFANGLQNKDLVKLLYSNFNKSLIVVELTLPGEKAGKNPG